MKKMKIYDFCHVLEKLSKVENKTIAKEANYLIQSLQDLLQDDTLHYAEEGVNALLNEDQVYSVDVKHYVDSPKPSYQIGIYREDSYVGELPDTIYEDGADVTEWNAFIGTWQECNDWIKAQKA